MSIRYIPLLPSEGVTAVPFRSYNGAYSLLASPTVLPFVLLPAYGRIVNPDQRFHTTFGVYRWHWMAPSDTTPQPQLHYDSVRLKAMPTRQECTRELRMLFIIHGD